MRSVKKPTLYVIMPCYNEAEVIPYTLPKVYKTITTLVKKNIISSNSKMLFVDDGSEDSTWQVIETSATRNAEVSGVRLSTNCGHQMAMLAGMEVAMAHADIVVTMDVDLQDDLAVIKDMVKEFINGADVVFGVRDDRRKDSVAKRLGAHSFYKLMKRMGAKTIYNHADFRLMSRKAVEKLSQQKFAGMQLRGVVPNLGLNASVVRYKRNAREQGEVRYTFFKLLTLAMDGITQFSVRPLQIVFAAGVFFCTISIAGAILFAIMSAITNNSPQWLGLAACLITFLTGVQLFAIWIVGEYAGRAYMAAKRGSLYNIDKTVGIRK